MFCNKNRDYEKEAKENAKAPPKPKDLQAKSFNFNKQNEFPNLYKGFCHEISYLGILGH